MIIINFIILIFIQIKEVCRSSLSKLEHIIHPRNDTLFFPLQNELEIPQSIQSILPENKTHFLNELVEDTVIPNKAEKSKVLNTNDNEPNIKTSETISTLNVKKYKSPIKNIPQEIIIRNDDNSIDSTPQELICQPIVSESNNELFNKTLMNISVVQTNQVIEGMDVDNDSDSNIMNEPLDKSKTDITEMLKDFIDSD